MIVSVGNLEGKFVFLLPILTIISQWISIAGIKLSWLLYGFLLILLLIKRNWILKKKISLFFLVIFLVTPVFTFFWGYASSFDLSLYFSIASGMIYFLYISSLEYNMFENLICGGLFSCVFFAIWGCYEIYTGNYILSSHDIFTQRQTWNGMHYPVVAFPNTNDIAQYLTMLFPMASFNLLKKSKLAWGISSALVFLVIYASGSRLCMMCFLCIWGLSLLLNLLYDRRAQTLLTILLIVILMIIGLIIVEMKTGMVTTVLDQFLVVDTSEDYYSGRAKIYANVLGFALWLPFGGFGSAYVANDIPPHNFFLFVLCDYGWLVAMFLIILLLKFGFRCFYVASLKRDNVFVILLLSTLILFPILSCVSSTNEQRKVIWIILGIFMNRYWYYGEFDRDKHII